MLQLSPRPLTASAADQRLFVDRDREARLITRAIDLQLNSYVAGPPGSGATSLLHAIERRLGERALYVSATAARDAAELVVHLARAAEQRGVRREQEDAWPPRALLALLAVKVPGCALLIDGASTALRREAFGRFRDELWGSPMRWVVTGSDARLDPPEDVFFASIVELGPLDAVAMEELLERRAGTGRTADAALLRELAGPLARVLRATTPRALLSAATAVLLADDPTGALARLEAHETAARQAPPAERALLDALLVFGPAHAGDERLLSAVGVTRTRVVQLFQELQQQGLLVAVRTGRRVLYDLAWRAT